MAAGGMVGVIRVVVLELLLYDLLVVFFLFPLTKKNLCLHSSPFRAKSQPPPVTATAATTVEAHGG